MGTVTDWVTKGSSVKNKVVISAAMLLTAAAAIALAEDVKVNNAPPMRGVHWARDAKPPDNQAGGGRRSPDMTYHGGKILTTVVTEAIFWGPSWANNTGDEISGLDSWYLGHVNLNYAKTVDEYSGTNGQVGSSGFHHLGHIIDTSTASGAATPA
jgi:hypothetical protein